MNKKYAKAIESAIKTNLETLNINKGSHYTVKFLITVFMNMATSRYDDEVYIANCLRTALPTIKGESEDA